MMLLVTGFFVGIIYTYVVGAKTKIFNMTALEYVKNLEIDKKRYLYHIIKERIGILLWFVFLGQVQWKRIYAGISTIIIGVALGSVICLSASEMGLKGIFLCMIGMMPHVIFYGLVFWILMSYWMDNKMGRWRGSKTAGILLFIALGIMCEVYVSPYIIKIFL